MRRGDVFMSGYVAAVCAAMGVIFWLVLTPRGGDYASARYHFDVRYPAGWQASVSSGVVPSAWPTLSAAKGVSTGNAQASPIALVLSITREGQSTGAGTPSSLTITVWDLNTGAGATQAASLAKNTALHATTIAGLPAYAAPPTAMPLPGKAGSSSSVTDTHTDYFLVNGSYEYQVTTDAISGENAEDALRSMLVSFTLTA